MAYRAKTSFVVAVSKKHPVKRVITEGTVIADNDPLVKTHADLLETGEDFLARGVEQATAAPGEKRSVKKVKADASA